MSTERVVTALTDAAGIGDRSSAAALTNSARSATQLLSGDSAVFEEILGDFAEDDTTRLPNERQRTEGDQSVTGADIEDDVTGVDARLLQHAVSDRSQELERPSLLLGVVRVTSREDPFRPLVPG